jgi:hypothetical protein
MAWDRMRRQYPPSWTIARATMGAEFEGRAATVYKEVAAAHPLADEQELWGKLEPRLFNASQIAIKTAEFEKASQSGRETIGELADRVRQLLGCFLEATPDAVLRSQFLNGVSVGLRREGTIADRGNFDELVSTVARLAAVGGTRPSMSLKYRNTPGGTQSCHKVTGRAAVPSGRRPTFRHSNAMPRRCASNVFSLGT